jgi:hypothetical protein
LPDKGVQEEGVRYPPHSRGFAPWYPQNLRSPLSQRTFIVVALGIWWTSLRFTQVLRLPEEVYHESLSTTLS